MHVRTTVEITEEQHRGLAELASRRKVRGFSSLVQEALDLYLNEDRQRQIDETLALEGSLTGSEADTMRKRIAEGWETWRTD